MVQSKLRPLKVNYPEKKEVDPEDRGHVASLYEIKLFNEYYVITLGKPKYTFTKESVVYYPIYLVNSNDKIKGRIGVYEIELNNMVTVLDEDGDVELDALGKELLFQFTTPEYIYQLLELDPSEMKTQGTSKGTDEDLDQDSGQDSGQDLEQDSDDEDDRFKIKKTDKGKGQGDQEERFEKGQEKSGEQEKKITVETIFKINKDIVSHATWDEETEEDNEKWVKEYKSKKNPNEKWVVTFMKNTNYNIIPNESCGDCFFATIRDAFSQIGKQTTVKQLRALLAQEVTHDKYTLNMKLYQDLEKERQFLENEMEKISKINETLKKQTKQKTIEKSKLKDIVDEAKLLNQEYQNLKSKKEFNLEMLEDVSYMKNIHHINDFREYVKTSDYWADSWAITTLETLLNIKMIILEHSDDPEAVMRCGDTPPDETGNITPSHYIIVYYQPGLHYELVSYQKKQIFTFAEIPYGIKILIIKKCMERNAGSFYMIPLFRQMKMDLVGQDELGEQDTKSEEITDLYDNDVVFIFHSNSDKHKKPGFGTGEKIPKLREPEFLDLYMDSKRSNKRTADYIPWRQQLDDTWDKAPFNLDNEKWQSISHYLLAVQFKETDPEIFKTFAVDSGTNLSKTWSVAKESIEKRKKDKDSKDSKEMMEGKYFAKYKNLKKMTELSLLGYRKDALRAKFSQNADLSTLLSNTKRSTLAHHVSQKPAIPDVDLMKLRNELQK